MTLYLDPKNDVAFKKVFGQHEHVLISFLNALLPLGEELEPYEKYWEMVRLQKSYLADAFKEGKQEGELKGKLEERTKANREFTISLIKQTDFSDEKIALLVGVDTAWVGEIRKQIAK